MSTTTNPQAITPIEPSLPSNSDNGTTTNRRHTSLPPQELEATTIRPPPLRTPSLKTFPPSTTATFPLSPHSPQVPARETPPIPLPTPSTTAHASPTPLSPLTAHPPSPLSHYKSRSPTHTSPISAPFDASTSVLGFGTRTALLDVKSHRGVVEEGREEVVSDVASVGSAADGGGENNGVVGAREKGEGEGRRSAFVEEGLVGQKRGIGAAVAPASGDVSRVSSFGHERRRSEGLRVEAARSKGKMKEDLFSPSGMEWRRASGEMWDFDGGIGEGKLNEEEAKGEGVLNSFFEGSSEGEDEPGPAVLGEAARAMFRRPVVVRSSPASKIEMEEMLQSAPSGISERSFSYPGPMEGGEIRDSMASRRSGVVGMPGGFSGGLEGQKIEEEGETAALEVGMWNDNRASTASKGLGSDPVLKSVSKMKPKRRVNFPSLRVEILPEHRFMREEIVSTPYPLFGKNKKRKAEEKARMKENTATLKDRKASGDASADPILTLVLYNHNAPVPRIKRISIPTTSQQTGIHLRDSSQESKPPIIATLTSPLFDDEKLFQSVCAAHTQMRGFFASTLSARKVKGLRLLSYRTSSQLAVRGGKTMPFHTKEDIGALGTEFAESDMLALFRNPRLGRGKREWVLWVDGLPGNSRVASVGGVGTANVAVELVEGWAAGKIMCAVGMVIVASILACLLWVFLGASSSDLGQYGTGFRHAGERVEAGILLGIWILLFGWMGIGGWVGLSWLVM